MKHLLISICCFLGLSFNSFASKEKSTITIKTVISCDHCLQCSSCGQNINDQIRDAEKGIKKVKIDPKQNSITVIYSPEKTNPAAIRKAIAKAGYDADELKASKEGYEKLDACCRR